MGVRRSGDGRTPSSPRWQPPALNGPELVKRVDGLKSCAHPQNLLDSRLIQPLKMRARFSLVLFLAFAILASNVRAAETVIISEFLAHNTSGLQDEDGAYSDWIEIFNSGPTA